MSYAVEFDEMAMHGFTFVFNHMPEHLAEEMDDIESPVFHSVSDSPDRIVMADVTPISFATSMANHVCTENDDAEALDDYMHRYMMTREQFKEFLALPFVQLLDNYDHEILGERLANIIAGLDAED